MVMKG